MTAKPTIRTLSRDAKDFVYENRSYLREYFLPLLAPLILTDAVLSIGAIYSKLTLIAFVFFAYFMSCLVLEWHRFVLLGPRLSVRVNPFVLKAGEGRFVLLFLGISMMPSSLLFATSIAFHYMAKLTRNGTISPSLIMIFAVIVIAELAFLIILSFRLLFMLPPQSVSIPIGSREARQISNGLAWRLFAASFLTCIFPFLLIIAIRITVILVITVIFKIPQLSLLGATLMFIFASLPELLIDFIIVARSVTVLSRLYQWSVQNRLPISSERVTAS